MKNVIWFQNINTIGGVERIIKRNYNSILVIELGNHLSSLTSMLHCFLLKQKKTFKIPYIVYI